jgi:hypothetical protein
MSIRNAVLDRPVLAVPRVIPLTLCALAFGVLIVFLSTYHLTLYPTTWFDEGSHLHVPKALVQYGVYADTSSEGFRYFGPTSGIGPTVMLPIAAAFNLFGIGLLQARLVMVAYLLAAVALFWLFSRQVFGLAVATLATLLIVSSPGTDLLYLGRQVLGEVPAFAFLVAALLLWWRARLLPASIAFGLVALTKNQFTLVLVPSLVVAFALDAFYYRALGWRSYALPLLGVLLGVILNTAFQFVPALTAHDLVETVALYRDAAAGAIFVFSPTRLASSLKFLISADVYGYLGLPAVLYAASLARPRTRDAARLALPVTFVVLGLAWFALGSIGWPRYAFPALAVCALFVARLMLDVASALRSAAPHLMPALAVAATLLVTAPLANTTRTILSATDISPQQVAAYLDGTIPANVVVETWEPELGFLSDHSLHYPPSGWLDRAVRAQWLTSSTGSLAYNPLEHARPEYLVVGPFGKYTATYQGLLDSAAVGPIASFGTYDIYHLEKALP